MFDVVWALGHVRTPSALYADPDHHSVCTLSTCNVVMLGPYKGLGRRRSLMVLRLFTL